MNISNWYFQIAKEQHRGILHLSVKLDWILRLDSHNNSFFRHQDVALNFKKSDKQESRLGLTHFITLLNGVQGNQCGAYHGVPDQTFIPELHHQTRLYVVDLAAGDKKNKTFFLPFTL